MIVITSKVGGQLCMVAALLLLGTWPALFNLLERRGRKPQHTYLDYTIMNMAVALIVALTLGQLGSPPTFSDQLHAIYDNFPCVFFAVLGGCFLCMGNMGTQYSLAYCGLSITEVVASSLTVVGGTIINYFLDGRINAASILFPGVACFLVAAVTGMFLHASNLDDTKRKLGIATGSWLSNIGSKENTIELEAHKLPTVSDEKMEALGTLKRGSAAQLEEVEKNRSIKTSGASMLVGLLLLLFTGASYILFSPAFNLATNDQFRVLRNNTHKLVVYTAFFWFSLTFFVVSVITNIAFLYRPILGAPRSSIGEWVSDWRGRHWAVLAGLICGLGNTLQFMGGQAAGYAAADSVQALPLVSTIWGVVLFGEYMRSSRRTYILLAVMLAMFVAAVGLLMGSAGQREH
eukprot:jgi/Botrbrau1/3992/Bobra.0016s0005.1